MKIHYGNQDISLSEKELQPLNVRPISDGFFFLILFPSEVCLAVVRASRSGSREPLSVRGPQKLV